MKTQPFPPYFYLIIAISIFLLGGCEEDYNPGPEGQVGTLTDIEGNIYSTIIIGDQIWMTENLKTTKYKDGSAIDYIGDDTHQWQSNTNGGYAWQFDDVTFKDLYGGLYNWYAVKNSSGLCPTGWHVSTSEDWVRLLDNLYEAHGLTNDSLAVNPVGTTLKSCRQVDSPLGGDCNTVDHPRWEFDPSNFGTNDFGFAALPGGKRNANGIHSWMGLYGLWWAYDKKNDTGNDGTYRSIHSDRSRVYGWLRIDKNNGLSVRCVKNPK